MSAMKYNEEELRSLKRAELQRLAKDEGLKANRKTDLLISDLLNVEREDILEGKGEVEEGGVQERCGGLAEIVSPTTAGLLEEGAASLGASVVPNRTLARVPQNMEEGAELGRTQKRPPSFEFTPALKRNASTIAAVEGGTPPHTLSTLNRAPGAAASETTIFNPVRRMDPAPFAAPSMEEYKSHKSLLQEAGFTCLLSPCSVVKPSSRTALANMNSKAAMEIVSMARSEDKVMKTHAAEGKYSEEEDATVIAQCAPTTLKAETEKGGRSEEEEDQENELKKSRIARPASSRLPKPASLTEKRNAEPVTHGVGPSKLPRLRA